SVEVLKQGQYSPYPVENQVAVLYALSRGHLDAVPAEKIRDWEREFLAYLGTEGEDVLSAIREKKVLDEQTETMLKGRIEEFGKRFDQ
ncbi:MAG: F0F1 ATP synthase subunit alpha, partial [Candidatus Moranbacteria bacterium]|nr:F0F1 ATP synthase subunit alpha [Candidatus Moranbacteria bacterium]